MGLSAQGYQSYGNTCRFSHTQVKGQKGMSAANLSVLIGTCKLFKTDLVSHASGINFHIKVCSRENQDGGVGRHTERPRTTRTDRKSTARKSDTKEIKKKHSSRLVGGVETGSQGGEDSCCLGGTETGGEWDERGRQSDH